ncbi:MAG TPA: FtsX-like permease family protein [Candidatus Dormibacteraeota bacterium]|nr:FtsX-like permease family protein [Candidatus Dormibacteraeota bacterium]
MTLSPLSVLTYYLRNKRRVVPLLLILALAVALMVVVQALVSSASDTAYAIFGSYSKVEVVAPRVKSQQDAYKPIAAALDTLRAQQGALASGGALPGAAGDLAGLSLLLADLQGLPGRLKAAAPSTAPLTGRLAQASGHGTQLSADLTKLGADLHQAQQRQSEQAQLAAALAAVQRNPSDPNPILDYLRQSHDFAALTTPDTTDYATIEADANRAAADSQTLVGDLTAVRGLVQALAATPPPDLPRLLPTSLPKLPQADAALKGLSTQLSSLQASLATLTQPQGDIAAMEARIRTIPGVARVERDTYANIDLNMLAGNANFDLYGLDAAGMREMLALYGDHLSAGRLPDPARPEVVISEAVARARGIGIGGLVGSDVDELDSLPEHFTVVGLIAGPTRLGFIPRQYMVDNYFFSRRYEALLVFPGSAGPAPIRAALHAAVAKQPYRIFDGPFIAGKIDSLLVNLEKINAFLTFAVAGTLALVIALLNNLYFRQRMNEFGLLAALGYPRRRLAAKVATEGALVVGAAWVVGAALAVAALAWFDAAYIRPHGLELRVFDPAILLRATLPVPVLVLLVSQATLLLQLARLDPISIIERRD